MFLLELSGTLIKVHLSRDTKCMSDILSPAKESKVKQCKKGLKDELFSYKNFNVK